MPVLTNPKHEAACQARAKGLGPTESYAAGGFRRTSSSATVFFQRPEIIARVAEIVAEKQQIHELGTLKAAERAGLSQFWVLERLKYNAERCLRGTPVLDKHGNHTGRFSGQPQGQAANRALELIGRELGMFRQQVEHNIGDFDRLTDDELEKRASIVAQRLGLTPPAKTKH